MKPCIMQNGNMSAHGGMTGVQQLKDQVTTMTGAPIVADLNSLGTKAAMYNAYMHHGHMSAQSMVSGGQHSKDQVVTSPAEDSAITELFAEDDTELNNDVDLITTTITGPNQEAPTTNSVMCGTSDSNSGVGGGLQQGAGIQYM